MKKLLALLLALVMVLGLAACGSGNTTPTAAPDNAPAADNAETAAPTAAELEPVTLKIWFHGSTVTPDASAKVMESVNAYLKDKINATIEPIWGTWGDFDQATVTALAGGDKVDMYFTCNWSADEYNKYAKDGYWVKLDDMLDTYAPELKATIPQDIWDCAKTNGYDGMGYFSDEFAEMLQKAKDLKGKDFYPLLIEPVVLERMVIHSSIVTGDLPTGAVLSYYYDAEHPSKDIGSTIVNKFSTDEFAKFAAKTYEYAQKGYISPSCQSTATANDYRTATQSTGEYLFGTQSYAFGCELDFSNARNIDVRMVPETAAYMDCTSGQGAMIAISATSANPERALMFLNLLNTDSELMTMMNYGTEGFTYNKNSDGTITFIPENRANYSPWTNGMGNVRILPPTDAQGADFWDRFSAYYDAAEPLPLGGFVFDSSELSTEIAALSNVFAEYGFNLMSGAVNPDDVLPEFLSKLEEAGINEFVGAAQEQLAAYMG